MCKLLEVSLLLGINKSMVMNTKENTINTGPTLVCVLKETQHKTNEVANKNKMIKVPIPTPNTSVILITVNLHY